MDGPGLLSSLFIRSMRGSFSSVVPVNQSCKLYIAKFINATMNEINSYERCGKIKSWSRKGYMVLQVSES